MATIATTTEMFTVLAEGDSPDKGDKVLLSTVRPTDVPAGMVLYTFLVSPAAAERLLTEEGDAFRADWAELTSKITSQAELT